MTANPLLSYGGLPPFSRIRAEYVEPAVEAILTENRTAVARITAHESQPTWDDFVETLETLDERLHRAWSPTAHLNAVMNSPELRAAYNACLPKLSKYHTELGQNEKLQRGYQTLKSGSEWPSYSAAQRKLVEDALRDFRLTGVDLPPEKKIDLLQQQGTNSASLLAGVTIPAGTYQWIRLDIDTTNSYIITSTGAQYPLTIPSGSQTGLKLVSGFTVAQGSLADFVIDFNLRQSITLANTNGTPTYILNPALRLINMQQVGTVSGTVSSALSIGGTLITATSCSPAVYVYPGTVTVLDGFNVIVSGGITPLTSATVSLNNTTGSYDYTVGFLAPGTYTLAATCAADDTAGATSLAFSATQLATVTANTTTTVNF